MRSIVLCSKQVCKTNGFISIYIFFFFFQIYSKGKGSLLMTKNSNKKDIREIYVFFFARKANKFF